MDLFEKLKEMKVLFIDDDEWIRNSLSLYFKHEGCHLMALESAEEGLDELKRLSYDIIICDYSMPGMNGLEFFKRIHKSQPDVLKILITAYSNEQVIHEAIKTGVHDFIKKPLMFEIIEDSLSRLIKTREENIKKLGMPV